MTVKHKVMGGHNNSNDNNNHHHYMNTRTNHSKQRLQQNVTIVQSAVKTHIGCQWCNSRDAEYNSKHLPTSINDITSTTQWPWQRTRCHGRQHACCWTSTHQLWRVATEHRQWQTDERSEPYQHHALKHTSFTISPSITDIRTYRLTGRRLAWNLAAMTGAKRLCG